MAAKILAAGPENKNGEIIDDFITPITIDFQKNNHIIDIQSKVAQGFSPALWQG